MGRPIRLTGDARTDELLAGNRARARTARANRGAFAGVVLTTRYAGDLDETARRLALPAAEVGQYLARTIRARVTHGQMATGPAPHYAAAPSGRVWVPPKKAKGLVTGEHVRKLEKGRWNGWVVCDTFADYLAAGGTRHASGPVTFVRTGELWFKRLSVYVRGPTRVRVYFRGSHSTSGFRNRSAQTLAAWLGKINPAGLLALSPAEMVGVQRIVRRRVTEETQINAQVAERGLALQRRARSVKRRVSRLLGDL